MERKRLPDTSTLDVKSSDVNDRKLLNKIKYCKMNEKDKFIGFERRYSKLDRYSPCYSILWLCVCGLRFIKIPFTEEIGGN